MSRDLTDATLVDLMEARTPHSHQPKFVPGYKVEVSYRPPLVNIVALIASHRSFFFFFFLQREAMSDVDEKDESKEGKSAVSN